MSEGGTTGTTDLRIRMLPAMVGAGGWYRWAGGRDEEIRNPDGSLVCILSAHNEAEFKTVDGNYWERVLR